MPLFKRAADILSANLNDVLDNLENPERMLRQAVREIEQACEVAMNAAAKAIAQQRLLARRTDTLRAQIARWHAQADLALSRDDETAARAAVLAKLHQQDLAELCQRQHEEAAADAERLRNELFRLRTRLAEARHVIDIHIARSRMTTARRMATSVAVTNFPCVSAFPRLQRARERIEQAKAESQAAEELCFGHDGGDLNKFDTRVELELEAIRAESPTAAAT